MLGGPVIGRRFARMIELVVRAELCLAALVLCGAAALLIERGGLLAWAGLVPVGALLALSARAAATAPPHRVIRSTPSALAVGAVAIFVALAVLPRMGWYRPVTVLSGSMRPTFAPGDLIIVRPEPVSHVRVGQVISYHLPFGSHQVETHRVIRILRAGSHPVIQTQGDANNWRDPWTARLNGSTAWRLSLVIPYGGYAINWLRGPVAHRGAVVVAPAVLALLALANLWGLPALVSRRFGQAPRGHGS